MAVQEAWAVVTAGATPVIARGKNVSSVTRNGVGDYSLTLKELLESESTEAVCLGGILSADSALDHIDCLVVDPRTLRVRTTDAGGAADTDFSVEVWGSEDADTTIGG